MNNSDITSDIELTKEIFYLLDAGIVNGYDAFRYEAELHEGYMEEELVVDVDGKEYTDVETHFNGAVLYNLLKQLKSNAIARGEDWRSIVISYRHGDEVKTHFKR